MPASWGGWGHGHQLAGVRGGRPRPAPGRAARHPGRRFLQGLVTNLTNPKAILFFAAVLPQFVQPTGAAPIWVQTLTLGLLDVVLGFVPWAVLVAVGVRLSGPLGRESVRRWWDRVTGTVLGGIGVTVLARG